MKHRFKPGDIVNCKFGDGHNDRVKVGNSYEVIKVDIDNGDIYLVDGEQKLGWFYDWRFTFDEVMNRNKIINGILN